jgi:F-type H+-transporting ATPase subunit delta
MIELIAKRYVKALMVDRSIEELTLINTELSAIASAFNDEKFSLIISSTDVTAEKKNDLILSFVENCTTSTKNLIRLLSQKKRLTLIPSIVSDLNNELAVINNTYNGVIYTNKELSSQDIEKLTTQFSNKLNVKLSLTQNVCDYDGIKVDVDGLGVEVAFSKSNLKTQMINHIIKAI